MDEESNPPIEIHRGKKVTSPISFILFSISIISGCVLAYAELNSAMNSNAAELAKQESRIDRLETMYTEIATIKRDVEWIRRYMEVRYNEHEQKISNSR